MTASISRALPRPALHWSRMDAVLLRALWAAVLLAVVLALVSSLAPPRNADAMRYHLAQPKEMLRSGVFTALPYYTYSFPRTFHLLFVIGEWMGWPSLSGLISWVAVLLASMGMVKTTRLLLAESGCTRLPPGLVEGLCLGTMYLTPGILQIASVPTGDGGLLCFFIWGAYILLAEASSTSPRNTASWVLSGVLLGLAIGTKYHGLLLVAVFEGAFAWFLLSRAGGAQGMSVGRPPALRLPPHRRLCRGLPVLLVQSDTVWQSDLAAVRRLARNGDRSPYADGGIGTAGT